MLAEMIVFYDVEFYWLLLKKPLNQGTDMILVLLKLVYC